MNEEPFRPLIHFAPAHGWMNDPNGLVYAAGEYHLFYQHNPDALVWGPMHWGHAVSCDLVHWEHLPIALAPDPLGTIFSGSAVVDAGNTAGFGKDALVAVFTHDQDGQQRQSLAYSTDQGRTWTKYAGNPVLTAPDNIKDFRDPKVFWYDGGATGSSGNTGNAGNAGSGASGSGHWVMAVAAGNAIRFYTSSDLKQWEASGSFGDGYGASTGVWETPELFALPVDGGAQQRWVLTTGVGGGAPAGGPGVQYFVGQFDGKTFTSDNPKDTVLWADYGADFYAAQAWNDAPHGRHIWAGWMNNWQYANDIPASSSRGALSLPRELSLTVTPAGLRLRQAPIAELQSLRAQPQQWQNVTVAPDKSLSVTATGGALEIVAEFAVTETVPATRVGIRIHTGQTGEEYTTVGYALKPKSLFVDRTRSGQADFNPNFAGMHLAELQPADGAVRLHIFVDRTSVELFANDGLAVITDLVFPAGSITGLEVFADGGEVHVNSLQIFSLQSAPVSLAPGAGAAFRSIS